MRVELRDGQWAELRERINHAADKEIKKLGVASRDDPTLNFDWQTIVVRHFLRTFYVVDPDGAAIPTDAPDAVERMPDDVVETLFGKAIALYSGVTEPDPATPDSSDASSSASK